MHAIEICRTSALGGHRDVCDDCGHIKISYNSCRNRHCPKCQFLKKEQWLEARQKELLPIPYFHVVFTIPEELRSLALRNQVVVYHILFKAAAHTLIELASTRLGVQPGLIAVLHTWGQNLMDHPHLHCIVTGGGLHQATWCSSKRRFLFPCKVMSRLFRGKFLFFLRKAHEKGELRFPGLVAPLQGTIKGLIDSLFRKEWVVYCKPPFGGPQSVIRYLGRYTHRVAITNHRLITMEHDRVTFFWKDYTEGNTRKTMSLDAGEFIRRFLLHILPEGFVKIRYFGLFANRVRKTHLDACRDALGVEAPQEVHETWEEHLCRLTGVNPRECPVCHGLMRREIIFRRGPP
jgi:hypothetical protein